MDYLTNDTELTAVADAIREKSETTDLLEWPDGFIQAIEDCQTGGPELEWLWGNQITNTLSGTIDSTDDAYEGPILNLDVDGVSTQASYTGVQLLNDATSTRGYRTDPNGNLVPGSTYSVSDYIAVEANTAYYFANLVGSTYGYSVCEYNENKEFVRYQNIYGGTPVSQSFTMSGTTAYVRVSYSTTQAGAAMVSKGSAAVPYEPCTGGKPSPNPDYPQDILSVDDLWLEVHGKNLLNTSSYGTQTLNGLTFTRNADGAIVVNGTATANTVVYPLAGNITIIEGTYTLSGCPAGGSSTTYELNIGGNLIRDYGSGGTRIVGANITTQLRIGVKSGVTCNNLTFYPQLELGSTATAYEPYDGRTIPLYDGTLRSLPDGTKDELHLAYLKPSTREGWAWYSRELVRRIGVGTITNGGYTGGEFDTTNGFTLYAPWAVFGITGVNASASTNNIRCDKLQVMTSNDTTKTDVIWAKSSNLVVNLAGYTTQSDANAALRALAPAVYYVLATPVTTQLDPIELPIMPSENATVWCDGGSAQPTFMLEYIQNANIVISRLEDTIADLATS